MASAGMKCFEFLANTGVYAPGLAKHAKHVPLNDSRANRVKEEALHQPVDPIAREKSCTVSFRMGRWERAFRH
jgi:hypothetical protein